MKLDGGRLQNVSGVRARLSSVLDDAARGEVTHVMRGSEVVAHIVPPDTLVHRNTRVLRMMLTLTASSVITEPSMAGGPCAVHIHSASSGPAGDFGVVLMWLL